MNIHFNIIPAHPDSSSLKAYDRYLFQ